MPINAERLLINKCKGLTSINKREGDKTKLNGAKKLGLLFP